MTSKFIALAILAFFLAFLIYPVSYVLKNTFYFDGKWSLDTLVLIFQDPEVFSLLISSFNIAAISTFICSLVSVPLALFFARYAFPGKKILGALLLVPLILPPFVGAVGMKQIFSRFGSVNLLLMDCGLIDAPIDWLGSGAVGVIAMEVLHLYPIMYLNVLAAATAIDPGLEDAARNCGARGWKLFSRVTFPLIWPGYFAGASIVFIWAFTDIGTPLIFEYNQLMAVKIFHMLDEAHDNPLAYGLVFVMVVISVLIFSAVRLMGKKDGELGAVRSQRHPVEMDCSAGRLISAYLAIGALVFAALLPHLSVIMTSVSEKWFMSVLPQQTTFTHFEGVFTHPLTGISIQNSLFLSFMSTLLDIVLGVAIAWMLLRSRLWGKSMLDILSMMPLAIPGIVLAFGYVVAYSGSPLDPRQDPTLLLVCAYAMRRLPYMVRAAYSGLQYCHISLEEAGRNVGATPLQCLRHITLPLVATSLIGGSILCFSFAIFEVSDSLMLAFEEGDYPIAKAIYSLLSRPDGPLIASAMGVLGMVILMLSLVFAGRFLRGKGANIFRMS